MSYRAEPADAQVRREILHQEDENLKKVKVIFPNVLTFVKASLLREFLNSFVCFFLRAEPMRVRFHLFDEPAN